MRLTLNVKGKKRKKSSISIDPESYDILYCESEELQSPSHLYFFSTLLLYEFDELTFNLLRINKASNAKVMPQKGRLNPMKL